MEKVLRKLMADMRLAGHHQLAFHEYKVLCGNRLFAGHSKGSLLFDGRNFILVQAKFQYRLCSRRARAVFCASKMRPGEETTHSSVITQ